MVSGYRLVMAIMVSSFLNRLVYYLQRLPFVGRFFPDTLYASVGWKRGLSAAVIVLGVLSTAAVHLGYVGLLVYWPATTAAEPLPAFLTMLAALSFVAAPVWNARVLETKRSKFVAVKLMRIPSGAYVRGMLTHRYTVFLLASLLALIVFVPLAGGTLLAGALAAIAMTGWRVFAEYMHLLLFRRTGIILVKKNAIVWISLLAGAALAYGPLLLDGPIPNGRLLLSLPFELLAAALGLFAAVRLARYPQYAEAVDAAVKRDDPLLNLGQLMTDARKADVAMKAGDFKDVHAADAERASSNGAARQQGYARLNALFFRRHRRLVRKPLLNRLAIIAGAGVLACAGLAAAGAPAGWSLHTVLPYLPFALFSLSNGERLCRALFYNCDMPLMRYPFYREAAGKHFVLRLRRLGAMNLMIGAALAAMLTAAAAVAGWPLTADHLVPLWTTALALACSFSIHHLLMYYLLQPYSAEMNAKNPLFHMLNMVLSATCWITIILRPHPAAIAIGALALCVLYMLASATLVNRYAPRTFRMK